MPPLLWASTFPEHHLASLHLEAWGQLLNVAEGEAMLSMPTTDRSTHTTMHLVAGTTEVPAARLNMAEAAAAAAAAMNCMAAADEDAGAVTHLMAGITEENVIALRLEVDFRERHRVTSLAINDAIALQVVARRQLAVAAEIEVSALAVNHLATLHFEAWRQLPTACLNMAEAAAAAAAAVLCMAFISEENVIAFRLEVDFRERHGVTSLAINDAIALQVVARRQLAVAAEIEVSALAVNHLATLHFEAWRQLPTACLNVAEAAAAMLCMAGAGGSACNAMHLMAGHH